MARALGVALVLALGCHDLDAVPRVGEVDGAVGASPDMGPAPLGSHYGQRLGAPFPVRGAVPHAGGVLVVGRDSAGDRVASRQALAAHFVSRNLERATSHGGLANDQFLAVTAFDDSRAYVTGVTREFGNDDLLVGRFDGGILSYLTNVGSMNDEQATDLTILGDDLILVGEDNGTPALFRVDRDLETVAGGSGSVIGVDFGAPGRFFGVAGDSGSADDLRVVAVGATTGSDTPDALIAVFKLARGDVGFELVSANRIRLAEASSRLVDVAILEDGGGFVAVGEIGGSPLVVRGTVDGSTLSLESDVSATGKILNQVSVVGGVERYAGTDSGRAFIGRREVDQLVFERMPFNFLPVEGRVAHFGDDPFLVVNNVGPEDEALSIYVAPLNADGRPACSEGTQTRELGVLVPDNYMLVPSLDSSTSSVSVGVALLSEATDARDRPVFDECPAP